MNPSEIRPCDICTHVRTKGESHGRAKVPDEVVRQAREMNEQGIGYVRISKALSVSVSTVANWCQYRTRWSA